MKQTEMERILEGITRRVNWTPIAAQMGKTAAWMYQRIHGYMVNGKPAEFTQAERQHIKKQLNKLAMDILDVAERL